MSKSDDPWQKHRRERGCLVPPGFGMRLAQKRRQKPAGASTDDVSVHERSAPMELGVFIPIGNNGWLISTTSPQYIPSFELNRVVVEKAERFGFDFALSMIKLHGSESMLYLPAGTADAAGRRRRAAGLPPRHYWLCL
jgi:hypothetical protein